MEFITGGRPGGVFCDVQDKQGVNLIVGCLREGRC
jgi:hypothetical protein